MENVGITTKSITINLFMKSSSKNQIICFTVGAKFELSGGNKKAQTGENFFKCKFFGVIFYSSPNLLVYDQILMMHHQIMRFKK
jgi:hypothetical protein